MSTLIIFIFLSLLTHMTKSSTLQQFLFVPHLNSNFLSLFLSLSYLITHKSKIINLFLQFIQFHFINLTFAVGNFTFLNGNCSLSDWYCSLSDWYCSLSDWYCSLRPLVHPRHEIYLFNFFCLRLCIHFQFN